MSRKRRRVDPARPRKADSSRARVPTALQRLLPAPRSLRTREGSFKLHRDAAIVLEPPSRDAGNRDSGDADLSSARILRDAISEQCGLRLPIESHANSRGLANCIVLRRGEATGREGDAHRIRVRPGRAELAAGGGAGLRYAVETVIQLLAGGHSRPHLPACDIDDRPDFALRGIMLDVSRGKVPTDASLVRLVDACARLKLNVLMLYTEHTFQFRRHPEIGTGASPLAAESMRELDRYAAENHVELIPCLQSLGHMEHILGLRPYAKLAESDAGWTISPAEPGTYRLLADLYDEFLPNFRSGYFNANCDEPWDLARGKSKPRSEELGPGGVYLEHVERIRELARGHGKRTMIWGDVVHTHPHRIPEISRDLVLLDWWYEANHDFDRVSIFADNDLDFCVCPGTSSWNCLFPRIENAWINTRRWAEAGRRHGALGLITTDWGDFGHYNLQGNSWHGYAWAAQQAWSGDMEAEPFDRAFSQLLFGDSSGAVARIYRDLGAVHDPGFSIFNGSALQCLFFDEVDQAYFARACTPSKLNRCARTLERIQSRIEKAAPRFARESSTCDELRYAARASSFAVEKAMATLDYLEWRRQETKWSAGQRRALASRMRDLADRQTRLSKELRRLWLARSHPSNFERTRRRIASSARSLRTAARRIDADRPTAPPSGDPDVSPKAVMEVLRAAELD